MLLTTSWGNHTGLADVGCARTPSARKAWKDDVPASAGPARSARPVRPAAPVRWLPAAAVPAAGRVGPQPAAAAVPDAAVPAGLGPEPAAAGVPVGRLPGEPAAAV